MKRILISLFFISQLAWGSPYKLESTSSESFKAEYGRTFESEKEPQKYATGLKFEKNWFKKVPKAKPLAAVTLPRHFDWREKFSLSPIKNQLSCGSCWSFSTVATMQDAMIIKGTGFNDLSEQFLLSCNKEGWSCQGGFFAHDYHMAPLGAVPTKEFPYQAKDIACKQGLSHPWTLSSWAYIPSKNDSTPPSVEDIKNAIYTYGPIAVGIAATDAVTAYKSGIFNQCDSSAQPNHAVNLVGWDDDGQYWIMRNSWGTSWGEQGYMRIKYGCNLIGISANYIVYKSSTPNPNPTPNPTPVPPTPPPPVCTPQPIANVGTPSIAVFRGQPILLGTPPKVGHSYHWEDQRGYNFSYAPQIRVRVYAPNTFTIFATTKCGTAKSSVVVKVR